MVSLSKKLTAPIIKSSTLISTVAKFRDEQLPFIPFSQLQKIKQLESQVVSTLEDCRSPSQIKQTHAYIIRKCLHQSSYIIAKLVRMLSKLNVSTRSYGVSVFSEVRYPNAFLYTALIRGYLVDGMLNESVLVYNSMRGGGLIPLSFTFAALLKGAASESNADLGLQLHGESVKLGGFGADLFVVNALMDMYLKCGLLDCGRKLFDEMPERDLISWTSLIDAYSKAGEMNCAAELFRIMPVKDMVAWTAMVTGFVQNAKPREALECFERMQSAGVQTDEVTLVGVINACAQLGADKYAIWVRNVAESSGFSPANDVHVGSALIDMYSKCGCLEEAYDVFECMQKRNVYSYSSMILGFAMHGSASSAIELFEEMVQMNVKPNAVTFLGVLTACSHGGLLEQGQSFFEQMEKAYSISPSVDHYNCMVDLLGRTGRLEEAQKLIRTMPMEPNAGIWGALLAASRVHGDSEIAEVAAQHLFKLEPANIGNYILLRDAYAKAGRWEDVLRVRKKIRVKGLRKNGAAACSWVEGEKGVTHEFYAGDSTHPRNEEVKEVLEKLMERVRGDGYEAQVSAVVYDVEEEEKRRILMKHSEKQALAYALLVGSEGAIRIVKNLRICEDCHMFMCGASRVIGREIIVRDNLRFHHFRDGSCSCSNFW
uniref:Pentatricopeptide repeat protein n=2 Tax=Salvia miltiorrhiza TaxID=226208 RepID=A0A678WC50_SALMI|nr:pentatricopeptide repeat protein [Salvia miltiorrhiza]